MTIVIPSGIPWVLHRVAVSGHYHDSYEGIATRWSLADLMDAADVCDALDAARAPKGGEV